MQFRTQGLLSAHALKNERCNKRAKGVVRLQKKVAALAKIPHKPVKNVLY